MDFLQTKLPISAENPNAPLLNGFFIDVPYIATGMENQGTVRIGGTDVTIIVPTDDENDYITTWDGSTNLGKTYHITGSGGSGDNAFKLHGNGGYKLKVIDNYTLDTVGLGANSNMALNIDDIGYRKIKYFKIGGNYGTSDSKLSGSLEIFRTMQNIPMVQQGVTGQTFDIGGVKGVTYDSLGIFGYIYKNQNFTLYSSLMDPVCTGQKNIEDLVAVRRYLEFTTGTIEFTYSTGGIYLGNKLWSQWATEAGYSGTSIYNKIEYTGSTITIFTKNSQSGSYVQIGTINNSDVHS